MDKRIIPIASVPLAGSAAETSPSPLQEQRLPRYTSYPPATEFAELDAGIYPQWLAELPAGDPVSLYLHIPYCKQLCWFCGCFTHITHHYEPVRAYLEVLLREIGQVARHIGKRLRVEHIHFGGGSPTILDAGDFTRLMDVLFREFEIQPWAEIAVEIDPRTVDREKCEAYAYNGVNRVSLGVQDFSERVQKAVNREQPYELVAGVVAQLRRAGIDRINLDLMYGLPYQTVESLAGTAELAMTLAPQRLAVFGYAHVPWMRKHQRVLDDMPLAGPEERIRMSEALRSMFIGNGYTPIGIDHYARKNDSMCKALRTKTLRRNFQGYTTDPADTVLGFGVSAIGSLPQGYAQNTSSSQAYRDAVDRGTLPVTRGRPVSLEDRMRRDIISELMCYYRVNLQRIAAGYFSRYNFIKELAALRELQAKELVDIEGDTVTVTAKGRLYVRAVCAVFDQYLQPDQRRYSLSV